MNKTFLDAQMRKMSLSFGGYDRNRDEKSEVWYSVLKDRLTERQLMDAVDQAIISLERHPTIKQFLDIARSKENPNIAENTAYHFCHTCDSTGIITVTRTIDGKPYRYVYKCHKCDNCRYDYPVWDGDGEIYNPATYRMHRKTHEDATGSTISIRQGLGVGGIVEDVCETLGGRVQSTFEYNTTTKTGFDGESW